MTTKTERRRAWAITELGHPLVSDDKGVGPLGDSIGASNGSRGWFLGEMGILVIFLFPFYKN